MLEFWSGNLSVVLEVYDDGPWGLKHVTFIGEIITSLDVFDAHISTSINMLL
jgi:hypothetical protein